MNRGKKISMTSDFSGGKNILEKSRGTFLKHAKDDQPIILYPEKIFSKISVKCRLFQTHIN